MHLTNYAINKHSENFKRDEESGSKRTIKSILIELEKTRGIDKEAVWDRVCDAIVKTILTVQPQLSKILKGWFPKNADANFTGCGSQCFEILGFDVMLDNKLKPWVLEVNHSPSFACDSDLDKEIKSGVISGAIKLLNLSGSSQRKYQKQEKVKSQSRLWKSSSVTPKKSDKKPISDESRSDFNTSSVVKTDSCPSPLQNEPSQSSTQQSTSNQNIMGSIASSESFLSTPEVRIGFKKQTLGRIHKLEMQQKALDEYLLKFDPILISKLDEFEDINMGNYKRIFPPDDEKKLKQYLYLISETSKMSSETNATKIRKVYMEQKKEKELERHKAVELWKANRERLVHIHHKVDSKMTLSTSSLFDSAIKEVRTLRKRSYIPIEEFRSIERPSDLVRADEPWKKRVSTNIHNMSWGDDLQEHPKYYTTGSTPRLVRNSSVARGQNGISAFGNFDHLFQANAMFKEKERELEIIRRSVFRREQPRWNMK